MAAPLLTQGIVAFHAMVTRVARRGPGGGLTVDSGITNPGEVTALTAAV